MKKKTLDDIETVEDVKEVLNLTDKDLQDCVDWLSGKGEKFPMPKFFLRLQEMERNEKS